MFECVRVFLKYFRTIHSWTFAVAHICDYRAPSIQKDLATFHCWLFMLMRRRVHSVECLSFLECGHVCDLTDHLDLDFAYLSQYSRYETRVLALWDLYLRKNTTSGQPSRCGTALFKKCACVVCFLTCATEKEPHVRDNFRSCD